MADDAASPASLGFLTVIDLNPHGLMGGYLLLNFAGRPLEFHCTAPIKPSRAQQILYGPTLESFLYAEQIGATLVRKATRTPLILLVDQKTCLAVREHADLPTACVACQGAESSAAAFNRTSEVIIGQHRLLILNRFASDRDLVISRLAALDELFDLAEPFGRIREAIEEAQRSTSKAA